MINRDTQEKIVLTVVVTIFLLFLFGCFVSLATEDVGIREAAMHPQQAGNDVILIAFFGGLALGVIASQILSAYLFPGMLYRACVKFEKHRAKQRAAADEEIEDHKKADYWKPEGWTLNDSEEDDRDDGYFGKN